jgi:transcriptional regulator with XRE-family HTH domain
MNIRDTVAGNVRRLRTAMSMSQEALAHEAGIDRSYISEIERSVFSVSLDRLALIAKALNVEPYELLKAPTPVHPENSKLG